MLVEGKDHVKSLCP